VVIGHAVTVGRASRDNIEGIICEGQSQGIAHGRSRMEVRLLGLNLYPHGVSIQFVD
jgi:hypothetical protein